jgi:hypothetical protein
MSDDYLWNGSGTPDPEVEHLEALLGRLRTTPPAPALPQPAAPQTQWLSTRTLVPFLATAAVVALMVAGASRTPPPSWDVSRIEGQPRIGAALVGAGGRLAVGETLATDRASRARIDVSTIGFVNIDADTSVRLVATRDAHHRLALARGTLHAFITAPPGQFVVDTPSATATDLGCVYTLHVNDDGSGILSVVAGWVAFEYHGRESFVPADAAARTDPDVGPGTPRYDDAPAELRSALDRIDFGPGDRDDALRIVLERARERDAMTLWHLIARVDMTRRGAVVDALAARVPMPAGVTRDAAISLDKAALDRWWDALGLREVNWWRMWKGPYPASAQTGTASPCNETPMVDAEPAKDPAADLFGRGPWNVNIDRTIWVQSGTAPWHQGLNRKVMWIRPEGALLSVTGRPAGGTSHLLFTETPGMFRTGFATSSITFPVPGCWTVTARAGDKTLEFVTRVRGRQ